MIRYTRIRNICAIALGFLSLAMLSTQLAGQAPVTSQPTVPSVNAVSAVGFTVADLDRSIEFFAHVLSFELIDSGSVSGRKFSDLQGLTSAEARTARLKLGDEVIELTEYTKPKGRSFPGDSRGNDCWFQHIAIIVSDMNRAHTHLVEHGVRSASRDGPQRLPDWNRNAAGIRAFYFRDPDGHYLEILEFPSDKGEAKWHRKTDRLFLGIDHTAIVVSDTDDSLRFYRDMLGFKVVGRSENHGAEQEKLNNVNGAHLRITTLRAPAGPAIEFLEYLNPRDGRPYPSGAGSSDILHWQTTLVVPRAGLLASKLKREKVRFVSDQHVVAESDALTSFLVCDPDGHVMKVIQK